MILRILILILILNVYVKVTK